MGRKDWLNLFLGVLVNQIVTLAIPPDAARGLFALAGTTFQWVWDVTIKSLPSFLP
jgi:hypothetical protein